MVKFRFQTEKQGTVLVDCVILAVVREYGFVEYYIRYNNPIDNNPIQQWVQLQQLSFMEAESPPF